MKIIGWMLILAGIVAIVLSVAGMLGYRFSDEIPNIWGVFLLGGTGIFSLVIGIRENLHKEKN